MSSVLGLERAYFLSNASVAARLPKRSPAGASARRRWRCGSCGFAGDRARGGAPQELLDVTPREVVPVGNQRMIRTDGVQMSPEEQRAYEFHHQQLRLGVS